MFSCCESGYVLGELDEDARTLDLDESAERLSMLLHLLHDPPAPYVEVPVPKSERDFTRVQGTLPNASAIPFPLLPTLLSLADKYVLSDAIVHVLHSHLGAYASTHPLRVYGYASTLGLDALAARTSAFLLDPPLSAHSTQDVSALPNAQAYHKLVQLHEYRVKALGEVLMGEEIFPYEYGKCPRHGAKTQAVWEERKKVISGRIKAGEY